MNQAAQIQHQARVNGATRMLCLETDDGEEEVNNFSSTIHMLSVKRLCNDGDDDDDNTNSGGSDGAEGLPKHYSNGRFVSIAWSSQDQDQADTDDTAGGFNNVVSL